MSVEIQQPPLLGSIRLSRKLWWLLFAIPIVLLMAFAIFQPIQVLPRVSLAPGYTLTDQDGNRVASEDLRGNFVFYTFADSQCAGNGEGTCIPTSSTLAALQPHLADVDTGGVPLRFVTIYVDADTATPATMQARAAQLNVSRDAWHFLTGDAPQLKQVIGAGFDTYYAQEQDGTYAVAPTFVLVDGWGIIRATYRTPTPDLAILKRDLTLVAKEVMYSKGINRYAYEAAHLLRCTP